jgi:hypothetical protein
MRSISLILTLALALGAAGAGQSPRPLSLVAGPRIDGRQMVSARDIIVAGGPDGRIVVAGRAANGEIRGYDSAGKMSPWKLAVGRADSAEIMYPSRVGWIAGTTTMWINDPGYRQIVLVDGRGKISKSIEYPSWIHPHWADRRAYPVFASMEPMAVYADSSMLVLPLRERSFIDTPRYDHSVQHLLRVSRSGAIERAIATLPLEQGRLVARGAGVGERIINIPFAAKTIFATSNDGMQLVFLSPGLTTADSGTFLVTALNEHGDTVFSRRYAQPAARLPREAVDRFLGNIRGVGSSSAEQLRAAAVAQIPVFRSFVTGLLVGHDHSTWVFMRPVQDTARVRTALVLDAHGGVVGAVALPIGETAVAVDRDHLWAMEPASGITAAGLVRYTVVPTTAPPARSGSASATSRRSRPPA